MVALTQLQGDARLVCYRFQLARLGDQASFKSNDGIRVYLKLLAKNSGGAPET